MGLSLELPAVFWFTTPSNLPAYNNNKKIRKAFCGMLLKMWLGGRACSGLSKEAYNILGKQNFQLRSIYTLHAYSIIYLSIFTFLFSSSAPLNALGPPQVLCTTTLYTDHRNVSRGFMWHKSFISLFWGSVFLLVTSERGLISLWITEDQGEDKKMNKCDVYIICLKALCELSYVNRTMTQVLFLPIFFNQKAKLLSRCSFIPCFQMRKERLNHLFKL